MKKIVLIAKDSIFAGKLESKTCEFIDSVANTLSSKYDVYVLAIDSEIKSFARKTATVLKVDNKKSRIKFSKVNYFLIKKDFWREEIVNIINTLQPEIVHNFAESSLIKDLTFTPEKTIYTFNYLDNIEDREDLQYYNFVTTTSLTYADSIRDELDVIGLPSGLLKAIVAPQKGFLLKHKYSKEDFSNKQRCKENFLKQHGIYDDRCIFLIGGLHPEKNLDDIIEIIPTIKENNGILVIATKSNIFYQNILEQYTKADGVIYYSKYPSMMQIPSLYSACDFYLHPKSKIVGNLSPMLASNYGGIPILAMDHHSTQDYFNKNNAIVVDSNLNDKILEAFELYKDKEALNMKRVKTMESIPDWKDNINDWILLYES